MRQHYLIKDLPLLGVHVFGIIDRGTNLLQVRSISGCPLNCIYCSVDEGIKSKKPNTYQVQTKHLIDWFNKIVEFKGVSDIEAHLDGVGEPLLNKDILNLIKGIRKNKNVKTISMQTNGVLLSEKLIKDLKKAGLDRINLSLNTLNPKLAKELTGKKNYDVNKIKKMAELIVKSKMKLLIAPVLVPSYNDDMNELIEFSKKIGASIGIQKFERQKHGRRLKVKEENWYKFKKRMKEQGLLLKSSDFNIYKCKSLPILFKKGDKVSGKVVLPGWLSNEVIIQSKNRLITVFNCNKKTGDLVKCKIVKTKHNLYLGEKI